MEEVLYFSVVNMKMKTLSMLLLALMLLALPALAQEPDTSTAGSLAKYRIRSTVIGIPVQRDRFLSPLLFGGVLVGRNIGTLSHRPKGLLQHNFYSANGALLNWVNNSILTIISIGFDYTYHHQVYQSPSQNLRLYGGGGLNSMAHLKIHTGNVNNTFAYDIALPLEVGGMATYKFTFLKRRFLLSGQFSAPLAGLVVRPEFIWAIPFFIWEEEGRFGDALDLSAWGNFRRLQNRMALDYTSTRHHKGKPVQTNAWRLSYTWEYYQVNRPNQVKAATHLLMLGRKVNI
jgi:hypothetical protein